MEITLTDIRDIQTCGRVGKWFMWHKLFYNLKDLILTNFGIFDGYDKQVWCDEDWNYEGEVYAEHIHILERYYLLADNNLYTFHLPNNEYYYFNFAHQDGKQSDHFTEMYELCKNEMKGKKENCTDDVSVDNAKLSLKRLLLKFGYLYKLHKDEFITEEQEWNY